MEIINSIICKLHSKFVYFFSINNNRRSLFVFLHFVVRQTSIILHEFRENFDWNWHGTAWHSLKTVAYSLLCVCVSVFSFSISHSNFCCCCCLDAIEIDQVSFYFNLVFSIDCEYAESVFPNGYAMVCRFQ